MRKKETAGSSESSCGNVWAWMHRFVGVPVWFVLVLLAVMAAGGAADADNYGDVTISSGTTVNSSDVNITGTLTNEGGTASFDNLVVSKDINDATNTAFGIKATGGTTSVDSGEVFSRNTNTNIQGNNAGAAGVYAGGGTVDMKNVSTISADAASGGALAVFAQGANSRLTVTSADKISANSSNGTAYGAYVLSGANLTVTSADTISAESNSGKAFGAYVNSSDVTLDVKTITANSTSGYAYGVRGLKSGKLTVTNAETISADSSSGAYGAVAENSADVTLTGNGSDSTSKIAASSENGCAFGIQVTSNSAADISGFNTISASTKSSANNKWAEGIVNAGGTVTVSDVGTISVDTKSARKNWAVEVYSGGVVSLDRVGSIIISGDNAGGTLYGVQAYSSGTANLNNVGSIVASGPGTNYGVGVKDSGTINLTNVDTVTASGGTTNYSAYVSNDSTLNVSTDATTTFTGNIYNAGTINGENMIVNGGIENNCGSVDITVKSISTDSGVDVDNAKAAVYAHDGGKTYIGGKGDITISRDAGIAHGAYVDSADVTLDVKTITAKGESFTHGVYGYNGGKLTVTNAEAISADSSNNIARGAYANNGAEVSLDVKTITAKGKNDTYGVQAKSYGKLTVTNANTISAESINGKAYGASVNSSEGTAASLDVKTITASGRSSAYGVYVKEGAKLTVNNAEVISADSINDSAYGAYAYGTGTEVSLDVKTITASGRSSSAYGVSVEEGAKLTVNNAEVISADSINGKAYGAYAHDSGTDVTLDVKAITASGSSSAYGIDVESGAKLTVNNAEVISADSINGSASGAFAYGGGTDVTLDVKAITASGGSSAYGIDVESGAKLTVNNAEVISAESNTKKAYGAYACDGATVSINGSESNLTSITATGKTGPSYGVMAEEGGTVNLTNVDTVTASGAAENYSAYVNDSTSTLNVSTATTTTFNGDVKNAGTLNINSGTAAVNGTLDLTGSKATVIKQDGKLVLAEKQQVKFGGENSFVINKDGSFTADAYNGNVLADGGFTVLETAKSAISADKDAIISIRLTTDGTYKSYTTDDLINVRKAIYNDEDGKLSFTGTSAVLELDATKTPVVKKADDGSKKVTITGSTEVVDKDTNGKIVAGTNTGAKYSGSNELAATQIVSTGTGKVSDLLETVDEISLEGKEAIIETKQFQVKDSGGANAVTLSVKDGSTLKLSGGSTTDSSLVIDKDGNALKTDLAIENGTLEIGSYAAATEAQQGTINKITMTSGTLQLGVSSDAASNTKTNYVFETLKIEGDSDKAQINVLNSSLKVNNLNTGLNSNSAIYVDPAYMEIANVNNNTLGVNAYVSAGSVLNLGSVTDLAAIAAEAGMNPTPNETGFTVSKDEAVLALNDNYTLAGGTKLIVDSAVQDDGTGTDKAADTDVYFGNKSLFVVNGRTASTGAALALDNQKVEVAAGSKLYINNVQAVKTYTIFSGASSMDINSWDTLEENLFMSKLIEDYEVVKTANGFAIKVGGYNANNFADTIPYNSIKAMADLGLVDTEADLETKAGIRFLSRATDTNYLTESAMKPTLNEVSTISTTAAIQHAALRATDAMTDAVAEHMSTTLRANDSEIHDGDTTDVWATPFYRSMSWSGGRNDADGYMSGFSFGIDKHAGKNARYGLAMHYGTGSTDSDGAKTDTTNSSKAIGVSLYGSKQWGKLNVMGQIGYTDYDNTMSSYLPSTMNMPTITASPNASTFTADVRAERAYKSGTIDITPHAGVRYTRVMSDSFKTYLSETQSDAQNIVQFPIGVTFGVQRNAADGWKLKGLIDLAVVPVAGNKDAHTSVLFTGLNGVWNDADTAILDSCSFRGSIGFTAERNYFSSNLGYALQTSSNETNHTFRLWLNWKLK